MARFVGAAVVATLVGIGGAASDVDLTGREPTVQPTLTQPPSHEPIGYVPALRFGFTSSPGDVWKLSARQGVTQSLVSIPSAPVSAPAVLQVSFPADWTDDPDLALLRYRQVFGGGSAGLYLAFAFKLSPGWRGLSNGVDNVLTLYPGPGAGKGVSIVMMEAKASAITPKLRLRDLAHRYAGSKNPWLAANLATGRTVSTDEWHHFELLFQLNTADQEDGSIRWWLDGDPMGTYEGIGFWDGAGAGIWDAEWRVAGPANQGLRSAQTMWLDDAYLSLAGGGDRVVLRNNAMSGSSGPPETVVAVDGKSSDGGVIACLNDVLRSASFVFNNLLPGSACPAWSATLPFADELVVFSVDDPLVVHQGAAPSGVWTASAGDWPSAHLGGELLEVPVVLWLTTTLPTNQCPTTTPIADCDLLTANLLYNSNRAGIRFRFEQPPQDVSNDAAAVTRIGSYCDAAVETSNFFVQGKLNVYYVPSVKHWLMGVHCTPNAPNVIYVSTGYRLNSTLAHELGHALGLQHTGAAGGSFYHGPDGLPRFTEGNLMFDGGSTKTTVSLGQVFRAILEPLSALNRNQVRTGPTRPCECRFVGLNNVCQDLRQFLVESDTDAGCPRISRGWQ